VIKLKYKKKIILMRRKSFIHIFLISLVCIFLSHQVLSEETKKVQVNSMPEGIKIEWSQEYASQRNILIRSESGLPQSIQDGQILYDGRGSSYADTDIKPGKKYYYSVISVTDTTVTQRVTRRVVELVEKIPRGARVGVVVLGAISQIIGIITLFDSLKDLWLSLIRVSQVLLAFVALKKKNQWGLVYDWENKEPLKNIPLSVVNERGEKIEGTITDAAGRFGFLAGKGEYLIKVADRHKYTFDPGRYQRYDVYGKVYTGDPIKVESETSAIIKLNVPLERKISDNKKGSKILKLLKIPRFLSPILEVLFWVGFVFIGASLTQNPSWPTIVIASFYLLVILVRVVVYFNSRDFGLVLDQQKKTPVPFAVVKAIKGVTEPGQLGIAVSNNSGNFYLLTPKGASLIEIKGRTMEGRNFHIIKPISKGAEVVKGTYYV
jgi:hypothetical protein